jgi:hypothetical protein
MSKLRKSGVTGMDRESGWIVEHGWIDNQRTIEDALNHAGATEPRSTSHVEAGGTRA